MKNIIVSVIIIALLIAGIIFFSQVFYKNERNESASKTNSNKSSSIIALFDQGIEGKVIIISGGLAPGGISASETPGREVYLDVREYNSDGSSGRIITEFQSDENGDFKVSLPAGRYCITQRDGACNRNFEVSENEWMSINITIAAS